ncbi:DUF6482 family protein [Motilimonas eburnea]|uniref:DUF6482 family protein n=1 Tax=Motilimonas eburnea TaxID=1737488 RepID=UPI001E62A415|nr:DUF6482 family protein [Motilimonas eburnea]MCE2569873.1 DUF6482 family protein [Motilimonas eburnea]
MQQNQVKQWLSHGGKPTCILMAYADSAFYRPEVIVHRQPEPITDNHGDIIHFNSLANAKLALKKLGFEQATLKLTLPYDEMLGEAVKSEHCYQDMKICL